MPTLIDTGPTGRLFGSTSRVCKAEQSPNRGTARTSAFASAAATASCRKWNESTNEVSSACSDNDALGTRPIPTRPSSNRDCCLACPYAKLKYLQATKMARQSRDTDGKRCWSKSYPHISRLKYANPSSHLFLVRCPTEEFMCRRCQKEFSTEEVLDAHCSQVPMCDPEAAQCTGRMTTSQEKLIKRKTRGSLPEANWFAMWRVLFPEQDHPKFPYFEDQIPLSDWDNALAKDLERLPVIIEDRLCGALLLTQLQQAILDHAVKQAVAEYSGDLHSRIVQTQVPAQSSLDHIAGNLGNESIPAAVNSKSGQTEAHAWSSSMLPSYLPRSTLVPGTTYLSPTVDLNYSLPLFEQQNLVDDGDLFLTLSLNPEMSSSDQALYHDLQATAWSCPDRHE